MVMTGSSKGDAPRIAVLIPAAGSGVRAGTGRNKVLHPVGGQPMIARAAEVFRDHSEIGRIVVVARRADFPALEEVFAGQPHWSKIGPLVEGGAERRDSVRNGIRALAGAAAGFQAPDWVLVHDGARPFCSPGLLERVLAGLRENPAVVPILPIFDTVRRVENGASEVVGRSGLFRCQTPQGFHLSLLREAHRRAPEGLSATDDGQLVEALGKKLHFVPGEERNFKVTTESDLRAAERGWNDPR